MVCPSRNFRTEWCARAAPLINAAGIGVLKVAGDDYTAQTTACRADGRRRDNRRTVDALHWRAAARARGCFTALRPERNDGGGAGPVCRKGFGRCLGRADRSAGRARDREEREAWRRPAGS